MANVYSFQVASYNCRGLNSTKTAYIQSLLTTSTVLFIQEHWLSVNQLKLLGDIDVNFVYTGVSGFDNSDILTGRPYGGCAILWRSDLEARVEILSVKSKRICAIRMISDSFRFLFINVYMPYEGDDDMTNDFTDQLLTVEELVNSNRDCHVIMGGDFNVDLSRDRLHTELLNSFCVNLGLHALMRHNRCTIDYSYNFNMDRFKVLDHFLLSSTVFENLIDCAYAIHDADNMSDHDPIIMKLLVNSNYAGFGDRSYSPHISWSKANETDIQEYRGALSYYLHRIAIPVEALVCRDLHCTHLAHFDALHEYSRAITCACIIAANTTIPSTCSRQNGDRMPGWSQQVRPLREKSLFWHHIWMECGRPKTGAVAESMRRTRAAYHYAIRKIKREEDAIVRERTADALLNDKSRDFWAEIKRIRGRKTCLSKVMDGLTETQSIAQMFAAKYRELFSSVPYTQGEMHKVEDTVKALLLDTPFNNDCVINTEDVCAAVLRLKAHKREGSSELSTDYIINAGNDFMVHIACLLSAVIVHGVAPTSFLSSTVVPIPKGHNVNLSSSENFRGIALSSIFGKIFDNIILVRYQHQLASCDLQFGFKRNSSTNLCSMVLKETLSYYVNNQTPVFCTFLDASKAFDRIHYCKLFKLLIKRKLPPCIIRILVNLYTHNFLRVAWGSAITDYFSAVNGVKQGAVLSPVLFCVYLDGLLITLSKAGVGCFIGCTFVGALAYADDIVLTAPTATAMRKLLKVCDNYAQEYCISFNASKTKCMTVMPIKRRNLAIGCDQCGFQISGKSIESVQSFLHLGHLITSSLADDDDIGRCHGQFVGQVNDTLCYFRNLSSFVRYNLFRSYCTSFYGCELWSLDNPHIEDVCVAWRKGLRRTWNISPRTHTHILPLLCNCLPLRDEFCLRFLRFASKCLFHGSPLIRFVALHGITVTRGFSVIGRNVSFCMSRYDISLFDVFNGTFAKLIYAYAQRLYNTDTLASAEFLVETINLRDGLLVLPDNGLTFNEINDIIDFICTT